jgi:tetratricopeptide (TPR) repeat protein
LLLSLAIAVATCGPARRIADMQGNAEEAWDAGMYQEALFYYEEVIELKTGSGKEVSGRTYHRAGIAAHETGNTRKTIEYLRRAHQNEYSTDQSYFILASAYRQIDNLSLEISTLEEYMENYPGGENINVVMKRLFEVYIESRNFDQAAEMWPMIGERAAENPELLENYFILQKHLENERELENIANQLLAVDKNNIVALEYLAEKYFWQAENQYQEEMKAYEKEKTRRQYRQLLDALDEINRQFRLSRDYFERLYGIDPNPQYARYLMNIYIRFGNEERVEYFRGRAN